MVDSAEGAEAELLNGFATFIGDGDGAAFDELFEVASDVGGVGVLVVYALQSGVSLVVDAVDKLYVVTAFGDGVGFVVAGVLKVSDAVA